MHKSDLQYTRGTGILEPFLAHRRADRANRLIPFHLRNGSILDIGCGSSPYFLAHTSFKQKFAVDQVPVNPMPVREHEIQWYQIDLNTTPKLPFEDHFFNVITLLAVVEHLDPSSLAFLLKETYRKLKHGGLVIITTPAAWSAGILDLMARISLVSAEEIKEHTFAYTLPLLGWYFGQAGFEMNKIKFGYFELMLNMWATAIK